MQNYSKTNNLRTMDLISQAKESAAISAADGIISSDMKVCVATTIYFAQVRNSYYPRFLVLANATRRVLYMSQKEVSSRAGWELGFRDWGLRSRFYRMDRTIGN
jgi:hypothetical protein